MHDDRHPDPDDAATESSDDLDSADDMMMPGSSTAADRNGSAASSVELPANDRGTTSATPQPTPAPARKANKKKAGKKTRALPKRDQNEDIFDYAHRPDVAPHIVRVTLRRLFENQTKGASISFEGLPKLGEVVQHDGIEPGAYIVQLFQAAATGQPVFAATDNRYFLPAHLFKSAAAPDTPTQPAHPTGGGASGPPAPAGGNELVEYLRNDLDREREERTRASAALDREREERARLEQTVREMQTQLASVQQQQQKPSETSELLKMFAAPGNVDRRKLQQEYDDGHTRGYEKGREDGHRQALRAARKQAREEMAAQIRQLQTTARQLDSRRTQLNEWDAELRDREQAVIRQEAQLQARAAQLHAAGKIPDAPRPADPPRPRGASAQVSPTEPSMTAQANDLFARFATVFGGGANAQGFPHDDDPGDEGDDFDPFDFTGDDGGDGDDDGEADDFDGFDGDDSDDPDDPDGDDDPGDGDGEEDPNEDD